MKLGLFFILILLSLAGSAVADVCPPELERTLEKCRHGVCDPAFRRFVRLRRVPQLRTQVSEFLRNDSYSPRSKRILRKALGGAIVDIRDLDDNLRTDWNIPDTVYALSHSENPPGFNFWNPIPRTRTLNQYISHVIRTDFTSPLGIVVPDYRHGQERHSLLSLIHELAHVRLDALLHKFHRKLVARLADSLARSENGQSFFNRQLLEYLHERYAREVTYATFRDGHPELFPHWDETFGADYHEFPPHVVRLKISKDAIRIYNISDPQIIALSRLSMREILLGESRLSLETDFIKATIENATTYEPLTTTESYLFVYATLAKVFGQEKKTTEAAIGEEPALRFDLLGRITESDEPLMEAVETLLRATDEHPQAQARVIKFLSAKKRRQLISRRTDWKLPDRDDLTLADFISSHPDFGKPSQIPNEYRQDPDFDAIVAMMAGGENDIEPVGDAAYSRFSDAEDAYHAHRRYVRTLGDRLTLFREPVERITASQPQLLARRRTVMRFWEGLKLADEFGRDFPNQRIFRRSGSSLLQIYIQLKAKKLKAG